MVKVYDWWVGAMFSSAVMTDEQKARLSTKRPLTKEEYEARQSVIRKVVDPETGRTRWAKAQWAFNQSGVNRGKHDRAQSQHFPVAVQTILVWYESNVPSVGF